MTWGSNQGAVSGGRRPHDGWLAQFLRKEAEQQAELLVRIRERVQRDLEKHDDVPGEDTMRCAKFAQEGFKVLATLELETAKVRLLAQRLNGKQPLTDEEYQAELEALGRDAIGALSAEELEAELARRRALPAAPREP